MAGSAFPGAGQRGGWRWGTPAGRSRLCPRAPAGLPLPGTAPVRRSQRDGHPLARLAYLDGLGQRAVLAAESCQGLAEESPPAARARLPGCLCSGRAASPPCEGPGQPPPPPAGPACCQGQESKEPWRRRSAGRALPGPLGAVPPPLKARQRQRQRGAVWERGAPGLSSVPPQSDGDGRALREGQQQRQCSRSGRRAEEGRRAVLPPSSASALTSRGAKATFAAAAGGDGRWPLLCTSLQERRCAQRAAPQQKGPPRRGLPGELPRPLALRERWGRPSWHPEPCDPRDPHLCLALDQPLQAAGVQRRGLGKGKREQKVRSSHAPDAGLEQPRGWAERRQEGHSRHCGRSAPAAGA